MNLLGQCVDYALLIAVIPIAIILKIGGFTPIGEGLNVVNI